MGGLPMRETSANSRSKAAAGSVALYLRVSTEEQRERQSIDTQREFGSKYTDLHELRVHKVYADDGIWAQSLSKSGRKASGFSTRPAGVSSTSF